jgi:hypothetical protein
LFNLQLPLCFQEGIRLAKIILLSTAFRDLFGRLVPDINWTAFDSALLQTFTIHFGVWKDSVTAFCCVYRQDSLTALFFNPYLVLNLLRQQNCPLEADEKIRQGSLFICAKLVREISHLLHWCSSDRLRNSKTGLTPPREYLDTFKIKTKVSCFPQIITKPVVYSDFGEMVERELFGGLIEAKTTDPTVYMDLEEIGVYPSKETLFGCYVDSRLSIAGIDSGNFLLVLAREFFSVSRPSFARVSLVGGNIKASAADSDAIRDDLHDDENLEWVADRESGVRA